MDYDWPRLKQHLSARRISLGLSKRECVRRAGVSSMTWIKVENDALPVDDRVWAPMAAAVNWDGSSFLAILTGGEPTEIPEPPTVMEQIEELRRRVERLEAQQQTQGGSQ